MIRKSEVGRWLQDPVTKEVIQCLKEVRERLIYKAGTGSAIIDGAFSGEKYAEYMGRLDLMSQFDLDGKPFLSMLDDYQKIDDDTEAE